MNDKIITQPHDPAITKLVFDAFKQAGCGEVELDTVFSSDLFAAEESYYVISDVVMYLEKELNMVLPFEEDKGFSFVYGCVDDVVAYVEKKLKEANKTYGGSKNVPTPKVANEKPVNHARGIKELVLDKIREQMDMGVQDIEMTDNLRGDLGLDSLDLIEIVMKLEKETTVELPDEQCNDLLYGTVDGMVSFVEQELKKANITYTGPKDKTQIKTPSATSQVFGMPLLEPEVVVSAPAKPEPIKPFNIVNKWISKKIKELVH